jgi:hypothetical protein
MKGDRVMDNEEAVEVVEQEEVEEVEEKPDIWYAPLAVKDRPLFRPIKEIIGDLSKEIPARFIKQRKQGGTTLDYIEWHTAASFLDLFATGWSWEIIQITQLVSGQLVVHGRLRIPCAEGEAVRDATGIEDPDLKMYGDVVSNAVAMAFKRAAVLFGLGRHLYKK